MVVCGENGVRKIAEFVCDKKRRAIPHLLLQPIQFLQWALTGKSWLPIQRCLRGQRQVQTRKRGTAGSARLASEEYTKAPVMQ